jgi:hypothetical protein
MSSMWVPARSYEKMLEDSLTSDALSSYLEHHPGGNDRRYTEFHKCSTIRSHHHSYPVKRIRAVGGDNAVERHLAHDQEDQEC